MEVVDKDLQIPEGLKGLGKEAAELVVAHIRARHKAAFGNDKEPTGGGCKTFYTPEEGKARGEKYGRNALVIVVHDGGDVAPYFNWDYECYKMIEGLGEALAKIGCFAEQCTGWYSAIYKD